MSGDSQKLLELAERVEKAEAGQRVLDYQIRRALAGEPTEYETCWTVHEHVKWSENDSTDESKTPRYTASLDAALTLAPSGAGLMLNRYWIACGEAWSCLLCTGGVPDDPRREFTSEDAASGPAALTAAALRARAAQIDPPVCECDNPEVDGCPLHWK